MDPVIFGEIVPQSICVRFGLPIGASLSWLVLGLMWICAPITWPIAKLLDYLLGEDHGTTYKKAGLKTLVTLHKTIGTTPGDRLNEDEVTIISGVLDLKTKSVGSIMTPMNDVFTLPANAILDEEMMDDIMREGYSRIPIYEPKNRGDFVGMLLVKMLITYDPEDAKRVEDFALATLPETRPETSCLDIINFFQQGKSHMVLVSDFPGKCYGALGVVTLEDVIEELIGEEIIDESDVFIDVHKAIRRIPNPGQFRGRVPKGEVVADPQHDHTSHEDAGVDETKTNGDGHVRPKRLSTASNDARPQTYTMRRRSSTSGSPDVRSVQARPNTADWRQQFNRLGPSNAASRPKATRVGTVMIKPGVSTIREGQSAVYEGSRNPSVSVPGPEASHSDETQTSGIRPTLDKGESTSDAVQALHTSYGTLDRSRNQETEETTETTEEKAIRKVKEEAQREEQLDSASQKDHESDPPASASRHKLVFPSPDSNVDEERAMSHFHRTGSTSTLGSLHSSHSAGGKPRKRTTARSGSITEQLIDSGGVQKLVLEMTESNDDEGEGGAGNSSGSQQNGRAGSASALRRNGSHRKDGGEGGDEREARSRRRQRRKKKAKGGDESTPLLDRET